MNSYGAFEDSVELEQFHELKDRLLLMLHMSCAKNLSCCVDVSKEQLEHLAQDIMRMSHSEPCGIKGAIIFVGLERKNSCQKLATIQGDSTVTPTFEVYVTLKEDFSRWKAFKKAYLTLKECLLNGVWKETPIVLCCGFQLEKKRLYRPTPA